jgi:hypothetical protein
MLDSGFKVDGKRIGWLSDSLFLIFWLFFLRYAVCRYVEVVFTGSGMFLECDSL